MTSSICIPRLGMIEGNCVHDCTGQNHDSLDVLDTRSIEDAPQNLWGCILIRMDSQQIPDNPTRNKFDILWMPKTIFVRRRQRAALRSKCKSRGSYHLVPGKTYQCTE